MIAYKLVRIRKDGSLGPLFINRKQRIQMNRWYKAKSHPTEGFALRPGWHCSKHPYAPHLTLKDRVWVICKIKDVQQMKRPESQGGMWYIAKWLKITGILYEHTAILRLDEKYRKIA